MKKLLTLVILTLLLIGMTGVVYAKPGGGETGAGADGIQTPPNDTNDSDNAPYLPPQPDGHKGGENGY